MTSVYKISNLDDEQLEAAINLMNAEHPLLVRNTADKMSKLIKEQLDVYVEPGRISKSFGFDEEFLNRESLKLEYYGGYNDPDGDCF